MGMNWKVGIIVVTACISAGGCFSPDPKSLSSDSAPSAVPAIKDAAVKHDLTAIPRLVVDLDDNDPAIRFAAITALQQLTGQTFGYLYYEDASDRRPAVKTWQKWLGEHQVQTPAKK